MKIRRVSLWILSFCFIMSPLAGQKAERLGSAINTRFEEREPMPSHDGKYLYIWRRQHPQNMGGYNDQGDIWVAEMGPNGQFKPARHLPAPLNSRGIDFVWQISPNHDTLFLSQILRQGQVGLLYTTRQRDGSWAYQKTWTIEDHTPLGEYKDYSITSTGHLLLPNMGTDTEGGPDLYVCFKKGPGRWGKPINLGPDINTRLHEDAPHLMADGKTLYFNRGIGREGPHDVYVTRRLDDSWQRWATPEPVGPPINTAGYEADFLISPDEKWAYWISDPAREGNIDIYRMPLNRCEVDVYAEGDPGLCKGDSVKLEAGFNTLKNVSYQWYLDGRSIPGATTKAYKATVPGSYTVTRQSPGCRVTSDPFSVRARMSPDVKVDPESLFLCERESANLTALGTGIQRWQWLRNGLRIPNANSPSLNVSRPGSYAVMVSNGECSAQSDYIRVGRMVKPVVFPYNMAGPGSRPVPYEWAWTAGFGKGKNFLLQDMAADPLGNSVILGMVKSGKNYEETLLTFDREGGARIQKNFGKTDPRAKRFVVVDYEGSIVMASREHLVRKYDASGSLQWQLNQAVEDVSGLAVDPLGHVYVYGRYQEDMRLGRRSLEAHERGSVYLAKFDPRGRQLWIKTFSTEPSETDHGNALGCDNEGNVYISGDFQKIANFGPGQVLHAGFSSRYYFLVKVNAEGTVLWSKKLATRRRGARTSDLHVGENGNITVLHGGKYFRLDGNGELQNDFYLKPPRGKAPRIVRITVDGQGTLFTYGLSEKNKYFLNRTDRRGRSLSVWHQKSSTREEANLPVLCTNEEGKLFLGGLSKGKPPSKTDIGPQTGFVTSFGPPEPELESSPLALCPGQSIRLQTRLPIDLPFYWLKDGKPLSGATDTILVVTEPGEYRVRAFVGSCEQYSNIQLVGDCNQKITARPARNRDPVVQTVEEPVVQNEPRSPEPPVEEEAETPPKKRRANTQGNMNVASTRIKLYVWDHGSMDNDTVSVILNDKVILKRYRLTRRPKKISLKLEPGSTNHIELYAHNLGAIPPNTASLRVDDGIRSQTIELRSTLKKSGRLTIQVAE